MNIFEQYGIKDVADVTLYSINLDENDNEIYIPVLYLDTLKVSNVEESIQQTSAQGGIGNPKLITWDYGKDITVTLTDALFTPASASMNWNGKLFCKDFILYLDCFYDNVTDTDISHSLRTGQLHITQINDYISIPEKWHYNLFTKNKINYKKPEASTSQKISCWLVNGYIISDDNDKKIYFKNLLLFYHTSAEKWYFYNGTSNFLSPPFLIPQNIAKKQFDLKSFSEIKKFFYGQAIKRETNDGLTSSYIYDTRYILTQNIYLLESIDTPIIEYDFQELIYQYGDYEKAMENYCLYVKYRYFANIGVENNSNITPENMWSATTGHTQTTLIETMEKHYAKQNFCINTDINLLHHNYRFLEKYKKTALTVYLDPKTMCPYTSNTNVYINKKGEQITGNLRQINMGEKYYRWTRFQSTQKETLGNQLIIDAEHYPGNFKLVGKTYKRDRIGMDHWYQFEIPLCKLHAENKLILQADGEPQSFNMKLNVLRRYDGVMMKLIEFDTINEEYEDNISESQKVISQDNLNKDDIPKFSLLTNHYKSIDQNPMMGVNL